MEQSFNLKEEYETLCRFMKFEELGINKEQKDMLELMFMTGANTMHMILIKGVGRMPEELAMELLSDLKEQLENYF